MPNTPPIPLLDHDLDQPTLFSPEALLAAVREERGRQGETVPPVCVLDFDGDLTDWLEESNLLSPCDAWACFHTRMSVLDVHGAPCGIIPRTIGGSYSVLVTEQLVVSGARVVIGLTSSGRVLPTLPIPSFVIADSAIRDEGASYHYLPPSESVDGPAALAGLLCEEVATVGLPVHRGRVWTTDAPYRETRGRLAHYAAAGVLAVEMQAASLFAFAAARSAVVGIVAHVTNAIGNEGKDFDKGPETDSLELLRSIARAGYRSLSE